MADQIRLDVGPWAAMPEWLLDKDVSDRAIRLYAVLARYAGRTAAYPSRKTLAERLRCSVDTVDRAVRELVEVQALTVTKRFTERGDRTSNLYVVHVRDPAAGVAAEERPPQPQRSGHPSRTGAAGTRARGNESQAERETPSAAVAAVESAQAPPKLTKIDGRDLAFDALALACSVEPDGPRGRELAVALNGSQRQQGIRRQFWIEQGSPRVENDLDRAAWERLLAFNVGARALVYRAKMPPGSLLTPGALSKWWTDLPTMKGQRSAQDVFDIAQAALDEARS